MQKRMLVMTVATVVLMISAAGQAYANDPFPNIPDSCQGTLSLRNSYGTGVKLGEKLVQAAWAKINDCDQIEQFLTIVEDNVGRLTLPPNASAGVACRYAGTTDGVFNILDALYGTCSDQCFLDGEFAGKLAAEVYCELSIALGGLGPDDEFLRGPVQVCGLNFEIACDTTFISESMSYAQPGPPGQPPLMCEPYTQGEYSPIWDLARNNQCAYSPEPAPVNPSPPEGT